MEFLDPKLEEYVQAHTQSESELLDGLNRDTHLKVLMPRMLSGHVQGRILSVFSHMIRPDYVLEIGTYTGYSALCMAEGLKDGGTLVTIDNNEELKPMHEQFIKGSEFEDKIDIRYGNAIEIIPSLPNEIDVVFIDADKEQIEAAVASKAPYIEIHTGQYAEATTDAKQQAELAKLVEGIQYAHSLGLKVNAGHGLTYFNVKPIATIPEIIELNIGHAIIARAAIDGLEKAVRDMKRLMLEARQG